MKRFFKIFTIAFICFTILFSGALLGFKKFMRDDHVGEAIDIPVKDDGNPSDEPEIKDQLKKAFIESKRINFVLLGLEGMRSDTMMFVSFDPDDKGLDIISIPRDTYYPRKGYDGPGKKKINAAYGDHGATGVKVVVSDLLLDVPVDYYVTVTYKGAASIVNAIGGVPITIPPQGMRYTDIYDDPPLYINFPPGPRVLNGVDAVKFLRYRKPDEGSGALDRDGDLGRIKAQQEFIQSALRQAMKLGNLPGFVSNSFKFVKTDMELQDMMRIASNAISLDLDKVSMTTLPGEPKYIQGLSYFFNDPAETREVLSKIYGLEEKDISEEDISEESN